MLHHEHLSEHFILYLEHHQDQPWIAVNTYALLPYLLAVLMCCRVMRALNGVKHDVVA